MKYMELREEAEKLLLWAHEQNPGQWIDHCRNVARAAETIAKQSGLDTDRAYVSGLLHDIGYYSYRDGKGTISHIYTGYKLLIEKGYEDIAEICLSHSFPHPCQDIKFCTSSDLNWNEEGIAVINKFFSEKLYNNYDKLIQLCDALGTAENIVIIEKRLINVVMRHRFNDFTLTKWDAFFALKEYFDKKCGINIYKLFYDEIKTNIFN